MKFYFAFKIAEKSMRILEAFDYEKDGVAAQRLAAKYCQRLRKGNFKAGKQELQMILQNNKHLRSISLYFWYKA